VREGKVVATGSVRGSSADVRDVFEDNMVEAKARSYWIKAMYA